MLYLGIDPGFTGAIACHDGDTGGLVVLDMPILVAKSGKKEIDHVALFDSLTPPDDGRRVIAYLEQVHSMPKQGLSSTFRFGQGYGALQMALLAHRTSTVDVTPQKWKKHFGLQRDKGASRGLATQRFPAYAHLFKRVKDDGRAEAALIALYAKEIQRA